MPVPAQSETRTVLVVSDDSVVRDLLSLLVKKNGFRVAVASSREQAVEAARGRAVHSFFVDARAIAVDSRDFLSDLHAMGQSGRAVLIADERDDEFLSSAMASGSAAILTQPFEGDTVARILSVIGGTRT